MAIIVPFLYQKHINMSIIMCKSDSIGSSHRHFNYFHILAMEDIIFYRKIDIFALMLIKFVVYSKNSGTRTQGNNNL